MPANAAPREGESGPKEQDAELALKGETQAEASEAAEVESWNAGPEYEEGLFVRVAEAAHALGYRVKASESAVVGSQDILLCELAGPEGRLTLRAETYLGVTVTGPREVVAKVRQRLG